MSKEKFLAVLWDPETKRSVFDDILERLGILEKELNQEQD